MLYRSLAQSLAKIMSSSNPVEGSTSPCKYSLPTLDEQHVSGSKLAGALYARPKCLLDASLGEQCMQGDVEWPISHCNLHSAGARKNHGKSIWLLISSLLDEFAAATAATAAGQKLENDSGGHATSKLQTTGISAI